MGCLPGTKYDAEKLQWNLMPLVALRPVVRVLMFGAKKYAPDNWQFVPDAQNRYLAAAMRHLSAWQDGELCDSETGISHLAHACCCLIFLLWFSEKGK